MVVAAAPVNRLALRKRQGPWMPAGVYFSIASVHGFNAEEGNELFSTHGQKAAGSCHSEVADWNSKVSERDQELTSNARKIRPLTIPEGEILSQQRAVLCRYPCGYSVSPIG